MNKPLVPEDILSRDGHAETRALNGALAAIALSANRQRKPADILRSAWPNDWTAEAALKAATSPTGTADFPAASRVLTLPNLAPASAALKLFAQGLALDLSGVSTIKVPRVDTPPVPIFVGEGKPGRVVQLLTSATEVGPGQENPDPVGRVGRA